MKNILISIGIWVGAGLLTILLWTESFLGALLSFRDPDRRFIHRFAKQWSWAMVKLNPLWNLEIEGQENLEHGKHYVFVSNHQSQADIVLLPFLKVPYKCLSKIELFSVPFFGWSLSLHRHIIIKRESVRGMIDALKDARNWLDRRMSVVFFVEGTRSKTGELAPFKRGAFKLAIQTKTPIVPLVMKGTRDALPKGSWVFSHRVEAKLCILPPIDTSSLEVSDADGLTQKAHDLIKTVLITN